MDPIIAPPIPFPSEIPSGFQGTDPNEPVYDPQVHLQIEPPEFLIGLDYKKYKFPLSEEDKKVFPGVSVTAPFRIVSDEGVKVLRAIFEKNKQFGRSTKRIPLMLRGLGYMSQFIRDFNNCPEMCKLFSEMANEPLAAHTMPMNYSHINVGQIGKDAPVDQWHVDSVEYVMVLIISDIQDMIGGDLQVVMHNSTKSFEMLSSNTITPDDLLTANYKGAGYCMFMQGSKMVHHVTPVLSAREPRLSLVNSYVTCNAARPDATKLDTFMQNGDPQHITKVDFARHKAWRTVAILQNILQTAKSSNPEDTLEKMELARDELINACNLLQGRTSDSVGYFDEKAKSLKKYDPSEVNNGHM
jgi:hypothetical protein